MMRFIVPALVLLLSACSVWGPNYEKPADHAPKSWRTQDEYTLMGAQNIPEMAWWGKFKDPVLKQLVDEALDRNNNIQSAVGNVYKARAILQQIMMNWAPTVDVGAGYAAENVINKSTMANLQTPGGYTAGFIPNYSLNILQQLRTQEQAEANVAASVAGKNAVRLAVISQVVGSYFTLREEEYRLQLQKQLVSDLAEIVTKFTEAYREGLISLFVLQQYEIALAKAQAEIPVIEYNIVRLGNTLQVLLNRNPGSIAPGPGFMGLPSKDIISGNIPSTVLKNRPDVSQAEALVRAASANIGVNTSVFFPTIRLTTPFGLSSTTMSNLFTEKTNYWQYQAGVSMPILNLGAYGAIKAAKGQYYADFFNYVETVKNAFAAVDSGLSAHQKYTDSLDRMLEFYRSNENKYEYQTIRFKEGLVNYPEVLSLRVILNESGIMAAQSKLAQLLSIVRLYQEMGGGYMYKNNETAMDLGEGRRFGDLF